jgi:hypothetical protein
MSNCPECVRLWREYAAATTEHIRLEGKLRIAELSYDAERVAVLRPQVQEASRLRAAARSSISTHEQAAHPSSDSAEA